MPHVLKETVGVTGSVSPASAVTDAVPGPATKNVAPTRAVTFDETAPMIKYVAPSPAVSNKEEEVIDIARCLDDLKMHCADMGMRHPMIAILGNRMAAMRCLQSLGPCTRWLTACLGR